MGSRPIKKALAKARAKRLITSLLGSKADHLRAIIDVYLSNYSKFKEKTIPISYRAFDLYLCWQNLHFAIATSFSWLCVSCVSVIAWILFKVKYWSWLSNPMTFQLLLLLIHFNKKSDKTSRIRPAEHSLKISGWRIWPTFRVYIPMNRLFTNLDVLKAFWYHLYGICWLCAPGGNSRVYTRAHFLYGIFLIRLKIFLLLSFL